MESKPSYSIEDIIKTANKIDLSQSKITELVNNLPIKRSSQQNKALHKLFNQMSDALNEKGNTFVFKGLKGNDIESRYTPHIVKEFIWKPLQNALVDKDSTTKITTYEINLIFDILGKWFSENEIVLVFPSKDELENKRT